MRQAVMRHWKHHYSAAEEQARAFPLLLPPCPPIFPDTMPVPSCKQGLSYEQFSASTASVAPAAPCCGWPQPAAPHLSRLSSASAPAAAGACTEDTVLPESFSLMLYTAFWLTMRCPVVGLSIPTIGSTAACRSRAGVGIEVTLPQPWKGHHQQQQHSEKLPRSAASGLLHTQAQLKGSGSHLQPCAMHARASSSTAGASSEASEITNSCNVEGGKAVGVSPPNQNFAPLSTQPGSHPFPVVSQHYVALS